MGQNKKLLVCLLSLVAFISPSRAGKYNPTRNIGDAAPAWKNLPGIDGKKHSLADLKDKDVIVIAFTCNSCPYAVDYEDRLVAFHKKYAANKGSKVALVAINVNKVARDLPPQMKKRAQAKGFQFPYLYDETQKIAREYGATRTPEFFVLNKQRKIVYMGALDDSPNAKNIKHKHVEAAVAAALSGNKVKLAETIAIGCSVRFERKRRRK